MNNAPTTPPIIEFTSPQASIPDADAQKTTIYADKRVINKLNTWRNRSGTLTRTVNILLTKLCDSLERAGVGEYDPDTYERLVSGATIAFDILRVNDGIPQQQPLTPPSQTNNPDVRPGADGVSRPSTQKSPKRANVKGTSRRRSSTNSDSPDKD